MLSILTQHAFGGVEPLLLGEGGSSCKDFCELLCARGLRARRLALNEENEETRQRGNHQREEADASRSIVPTGHA